MNSSLKRAGRKVRLSLSRPRRSAVLLPDTCCCSPPDDFDFLIHLNLAAPDDLAVQRKLSPETLDDIAQYIRVVSERIGVEGRHNAPAPKVVDANRHVTDEKLTPLPFPLFHPGDASDDQVGPKPPPVPPKLCNRAIGRDQERKYVEAIQRVVADQARAGTYDLLDAGQYARIRPRPVVDEWIAVRAQRSVESKQPGMCPRGDRAALLVLNLDDAVALDP